MLSVRRVRRLALLLALGTFGISGPLRAQTVTVGTASLSGNCIPFGCPNSFVISRYQQVYAAAAFSGISGPIDIVGLTFFDALGSSMANATYSFFLSTTNAAVNGLSTNLSANVGSDETPFATVTTGGTTIGPTFTVNGSPFTYDPTLGNLLMDVFISSVGDGNAFFAYDVSGSVTSRAFDQGASAVASTLGLVTQFTYETAPVTATPEPATVSLMATGLIGLAGWQRRRVRASQG